MTPAPTPAGAGPVVLVAATANPGKLGEIAAILGAAVTLLPRPDAVGEVVEDGDTLVANAALKARAVSAAAGLPAVADDTGLEVDALDGRPGVHSARYAGPGATDADNVAALLGALEGVDDPRRTARFRTVAYVEGDGDPYWAEGVCEGTIAMARRGDGGFGYDPVFVPRDGDGRTFAEMAPADKDAISHRGAAFRALADLIDRRHPGGA